MAKSKGSSSFWRELLKSNLYKRNQGRLTRQLTAAGFALIVILGAWTLSEGLLSSYVNSQFVVTVSFSGTDENSETENKLRKLQENSGGVWASSKIVANSRQIEVRFPTSRFYETNDDLRDQQSVKMNRFVSDAQKVPGTTKPEPGHVVQQVRWIKIYLPLAIAMLGVWIIYRAVNYPRFADFLISVEAEMDKVSWASRQELQRATVVVVCTMFFLGFVLFVYDQFWVYFFRLIGFLQL